MCIVYPPAQQGHGGVIHHAFITLKMVDEYQVRVLKVGYSARGVNGFPEFIVEKGHSLLRTDSWYISAYVVAIGLPTVWIWGRANAGCHSWNPLSCLLSCFVPLTEG